MTTTEQIGPVLVERMVALVQEMVRQADRCSEFLESPGSNFILDEQFAVKEARAIVALFPEPVDPDLIEARHIAAGLMGYHSKWGVRIFNKEAVVATRDGGDDANLCVITTLAGIKRGRELAQGDKS